MNASDHRPPPETPRFEPEIIPPGQSSGRRTRGRVDEFVFVDGQGRTHRAAFKMPGPFAIGATLALVALVGVLVITLAFSVAIVLIPVIAVALAGAIAYAYTRRWWNRVRGG